jgi:hypothetical protein
LQTMSMLPHLATVSSMGCRTRAIADISSYGEGGTFLFADFLNRPF